MHSSRWFGVGHVVKDLPIFTVRRNNDLIFSELRRLRSAYRTTNAYSGELHDGLADPSGFGVERQGVVDGVLRRLASGDLSTG